MLNEELKPCPFCGFDNPITDTITNQDGTIRYIIFCDNCGSTASRIYWQSRFIEDALTAERDALIKKYAAFQDEVDRRPDEVEKRLTTLSAERDLLKKENQQQYDSLLAYEESVKIRSDEILRLIDKIHKLQKERDLLKSQLAQAREALANLLPIAEARAEEFGQLYAKEFVNAREILRKLSE